MATRWARFIRGWLTAGASVLVAAVSHVAGGGAVPGVLGTSLALAFAGMVCIALAGKTLSLPRVAVSVGLSQFAFHTLFGLGAGPSAASMTGSMAHAPGVAHQHSAAVLDPALLSAASGATPMAAHGASMWIAHVIAALITIIALRRGEAAFWGLVELARSALAAVLLPRPLAVTTTLVKRVRLRLALADRSGLRDLGVLLVRRPLRGPPVLVLG